MDDRPESMTVSPNGFWHLSLPHSLYLGGTDAAQFLPPDLKARGSFIGCIQKVISLLPFLCSSALFSALNYSQ